MSATPLFAAAELAGRNHFEASAWSSSEGEKARIIDLMMALQSSLDVGHTLGKFSEYLQEILPHGGVSFSSVKGRAGAIDKHYGHGYQAGFSWRILLYAAGRELGWLEIHLDEMPGADQQHQVEQVLRYLIHPLHNAVRFDRMSEQALLDDLTGLGSRCALMRALGHEVARVRRSGEPTKLALLVMDLDGFKALNDELGHLAGDQALRQVAAAARSGLRDCDRLFRYGGDEFVALLPDADDAAARLVATRLEELVQDTCRDPQLYLSAGSAQWRINMEPMDLFAAADQALYARKRLKKKLIQASTSSM